MLGPRDVSLGAVSVPVFGCCIWFLCGRCLGPRLDVWALQLDVWVRCCVGLNEKNILLKRAKENNSKDIRYHKMLDLILTMICDNAALYTSFQLLERELSFFPFCDLKLFLLQSDTTGTDVCQGGKFFGRAVTKSVK